MFHDYQKCGTDPRLPPSERTRSKQQFRQVALDVAQVVAGLALVMDSAGKVAELKAELTAQTSHLL